MAVDFVSVLNNQVDESARPAITFRGCLVGAYLFSVPAFSYSDLLGLSIIPQVIGIVLLAYAILDIAWNQSIRIPREILIYGFLGLWAAVTFFLAASTAETETLRLGSLIKVVLATLSCAQLIKDDADFLTALKIFVFSIFVVYLLNKDALQFLRYADQITESDRFAGTMSNANFAANFALIVIWGSMFLLLYERKKSLMVVVYLIPIGISLLIIYYSGSKKGLIGIGLFVLFFSRLLYIRQRSAYRKVSILLVSSILIILVAYFIYTSPFFFRLEEFGRSESDIRRFELAVEAINVWLMNFKTFFMGVGYENFRLFSRYQTYAHSTPLEILASNGIIGLSLFLGFMFLLFYKFYYLYKFARNQELKTAFFSALIVLALFSLFMLAEPLHDSRELLPILGSLAAFGQYHILRMRNRQTDDVADSVHEDPTLLST